MAYGTMVKLTASDGDIDTIDNLTMFESFGKAVILNGSNKKIADFANSKITTASIGSHPPDYGTILTGGTSEAKMRVDYITSLTDACTIYGFRSTIETFISGETVTGIDDDGNSISFAINADEVAAPHWYNYTTFGNSTDFGALPSKLYLGCMYLGRLYSAGDPAYPHQWYATRQGNIWDWLYNSDDAQSAVTGGDVDIGVSQDIIKALIPYNDDYLLFGCANSFYAIIGDPTQGGSMKHLPCSVGIFGQNSWCFDDLGNIYFWGTGGIYKIAPDLSSIENVTKFKLPGIISDTAAVPSTQRITMSYDFGRHGIIICVTTLADGTNKNYWYEQRTDGLFYETYPEECAVYSSAYYDSNVAAHKELLLGCADGHIRKFSDSSKSDDIGAVDETIDSYMTFGPFPLSNISEGDGIINSVTGILSGGASNGSQSDSNDVTYYIYVGDSAEEVIEKVNVDSYSISGILYAPGYQAGKKQRKGVRGKWGALKLRNATIAQSWGMESIEIDIIPSGRLL
jgi:hypothetical protein